MSFWGRKKEYQFEVTLELEDLTSVPLLNAVVFAKIRFLVTNNKFVGYTPREELLNHQVTWKKKFNFRCVIFSNSKTMELEKMMCRISIRKELKGGKTHHKIGFVDINLSEFAGSGKTCQKFILEGYDSKKKLDNSVLKLNIDMSLISGDPCFKVPKSNQSLLIECDNNEDSNYEPLQSFFQPDSKLTIINNDQKGLALLNSNSVQKNLKSLEINYKDKSTNSGNNVSQNFKLSSSASHLKGCELIDQHLSELKYNEKASDIKFYFNDQVNIFNILPVLNPNISPSCKSMEKLNKGLNLNSGEDFMFNSLKLKDSNLTKLSATKKFDNNIKNKNIDNNETQDQNNFLKFKNKNLVLDQDHKVHRRSNSENAFFTKKNDIKFEDYSYCSMKRNDQNKEFRINECNIDANQLIDDLIQSSDFDLGSPSFEATGLQLIVKKDGGTIIDSLSSTSLSKSNTNIKENRNCKTKS